MLYSAAGVIVSVPNMHFSEQRGQERKLYHFVFLSLYRLLAPGEY
jgi:hypothetical protein